MLSTAYPDDVALAGNQIQVFGTEGFLNVLLANGWCQPPFPFARHAAAGSTLLLPPERFFQRTSLVWPEDRWIIPAFLRYMRVPTC
jgi:hypothetical protein